MRFISLVMLICCVCAADDKTWAFKPGNDEFKEEAVLDLRFLNEKEAGQNGFIRISDDGNGFVRGDGKPIKFWAVGSFYGKKVTDEDMARHARFLAKMGVNGVRVGGANAGLIPQEKGCRITDVNEKELKKIWHTVAAMKKEGIYTRFSPFWDHGSVKYVNPDWGLEGYGKGDRLNALIFFEPTLQKGWKAWMKKLLTEPNPYTGIPLKDDPGFAILQIVSEDSLFFHWTNNIKGGPRRLLETMFADFAKEKYGSLDKAFATWGDNAETKGDAVDEGRLGLYIHWAIEQWPGQGNIKRIRDQIEFYAKVERKFFTDMKAYLKDELGAKQIITASNFGSADEVRLGDLQRWCWTAGDVVELNSFFGSNVTGQHAAWRVQAGHKYTPKSALRSPKLPACRKQVVGMPFNISSTSWVPPQDYYAEGPILNAAYGAMNGLDAFYWLGCTAPGYDDPYFRFTKVKGTHPMKRWTISHPAFLSQFPAAALIFRKGLIDQADVVIHEERTIDEMLDRKPPLLAEVTDYKAVENADDALDSKRDLMAKVEPEAFLIGRVEVRYGGNPANSRVADLKPYIDGDTVKSTTGELTLDRKVGLLKIDAPKAQGVVGFLKEAGGVFKLSQFEVSTQNEFASIVAVALDDKPLQSSEKILIQVGTQAFPTGWKTKEAKWEKKGREYEGVEILSTGDLPWQMNTINAEFKLQNPIVDEAILLDERGYKSKALDFTRKGTAISVTLPPASLYIVLQKK